MLAILLSFCSPIVCFGGAVEVETRRTVDWGARLWNTAHHLCKHILMEDLWSMQELELLLWERFELACSW